MKKNLESEYFKATVFISMLISLLGITTFYSLGERILEPPYEATFDLFSIAVIHCLFMILGGVINLFVYEWTFGYKIDLTTTRELRFVWLYGLISPFMLPVTSLCAIIKLIKIYFYEDSKI